MVALLGHALVQQEDTVLAKVQNMLLVGQSVKQLRQHTGFAK